MIGSRHARSAGLCWFHKSSGSEETTLSQRHEGGDVQSLATHSDRGPVTRADCREVDSRAALQAIQAARATLDTVAVVVAAHQLDVDGRTTAGLSQLYSAKRAERPSPLRRQRPVRFGGRSWWLSWWTWRWIRRWTWWWAANCSGGVCTSSPGFGGGGGGGPINASPLSGGGSSCSACPSSPGSGGGTPCSGGACGTGPSTSDQPVYLTRGSVIESVTDLALPGPIAGWSHHRSYDSLRLWVGSAEMETGGGVRWANDALGPYLFVESGSPPPLGLFPVGSSKRLFSENISGYTVPADYLATMVKSGSGASEIFTLTETDTGNVYIFGGFNASVPAHDRGKLKERTTCAYQEQGLSGIEYTYSATSGYCTQVTTADPQGWTINYTYYSTGTESGRLQKIEVQNGSSTVIQKVEYTYYGNVTSPSSDLGTTGNLVQVKVSKLASDGTNWTVRYTQYRYYSATSGTRDGSKHQLKMVLEADAVERINQAGNTSVDTPDEILSQADSYTVTGSNAVADYSNRQFTYYTSDLNTSAFDHDRLGLGEPVDQVRRVQHQRIRLVYVRPGQDRNRDRQLCDVRRRRRGGRDYEVVLLHEPARRDEHDGR